MEAVTAVRRPSLGSPRTVSIALTGRCNLRCSYCFYANEMTALADLKTEQWLRFFDQLGAMGVMRVSLSGGEVFTRGDLFELIDGVIDNRMRYSLLTNGTLVDDQLVSRFHEGRRRARLDSIQLSIDGATAEVHNRSRPRSFERATAGLKALVKEGFPVTVRVTVNRHNVHQLDRLAEFLLEEIGIRSFTTNDAMPVGSGCQNADDVGLDAEGQRAAMAALERITERYQGRVTALAGPLARARMFEDMVQARRTGKLAKNWEMGRLSSCGCVYSRIDVLHDGTIVPCNMLPGLRLGNVAVDSLADIWASHPILDQMRSRRTIAMRTLPGCDRCEWNAFCNGGCPGLAHQLTGELNMPDPTSCYRSFLDSTGGELVD